MTPPHFPGQASEPKKHLWYETRRLCGHLRNETANSKIANTDILWLQGMGFEGLVVRAPSRLVEDRPGRMET